MNPYRHLRQLFALLTVVLSIHALTGCGTASSYQANQEDFQLKEANLHTAFFIPNW